MSELQIKTSTKNSAVLKEEEKNLISNFDLSLSSFRVNSTCLFSRPGVDWDVLQTVKNLPN